MIKSIIVFITISSVSCTMFATENLYYEFNRIHITTEHGEFYVGYEPAPRLEIVDGQDIEIWGDPYRFNVQYYTKNEIKVIGGEINNLRITSLETNKDFQSYDKLVDVYRRENLGPENRKREILGFGIEFSIIPFQDHKVIFDYEIYSDNEILLEKGQIDTTITTNYYKARQRRIAISN